MSKGLSPCWPRGRHWSEAHAAVPVVGDDDDFVALDESDEALELVELRLHLLAPRLLGQRVRQQRQLLVRVLQVRPVAAETLLVCVGRNECKFLGSLLTYHSPALGSCGLSLLGQV